jgi:hypothetical protein
MAIPREPKESLSDNLSGGLRRDYTPAPQLTRVYLLGVLKANRLIRITGDSLLEQNHTMILQDLLIRVILRNASFCG